MGNQSYFAARGVGVLLACALVSGAGAATGKELLAGTVPSDEGDLAFTLSGESRRNVVGGSIVLGERSFEIAKVSRHGLVGAHRFNTDGANQYAEFVVFSSSYTDQTAVGAPWVAAREAHRCDEPYNAFIAIYRIDGEDAVKALGPTPYPVLVEDVERSNGSRVYCFVGTPAEP